MTYRNPEYVTKITRYILGRMAQGKTWEESFMELGKKAGIKDFNPGNPTESQMEEIAKYL